MGVFTLALLMLTAPAAFSQKDQPQRLYTYVSQFQVPRANWAQFSDETEKIVDPVFERLMADGTIVSWGDFESVVHTPDGMTHRSWWQATSFAGQNFAVSTSLRAVSHCWIRAFNPCSSTCSLCSFVF